MASPKIELTCFLIYPEDAKEKIKKIKNNLFQSVKRITEEGANFVLSVRDFNYCVPGRTKKSPQERIDPDIHNADLVIAVIQNGKGSEEGFQHEFEDVINNKSKDLLVLFPEKQCEGRKFVLSKEKNFREKYLGVQYTEKEFDVLFIEKVNISITEVWRELKKSEIADFSQIRQSNIQRGRNKKQSKKKNNLKLLEKNRKEISEILFSFGKKIFLYEAILSLIPSLDLRDNPLREKIRNYLKLSSSQEEVFLKFLLDKGILKKVGDLIFFRNEELGKELVSDLVKNKKLGLSSIFDKIIKDEN